MNSRKIYVVRFCFGFVFCFLETLWGPTGILTAIGEFLQKEFAITFSFFYELQNDEFMPPGIENPDQERA